MRRFLTPSIACSLAGSPASSRPCSFSTSFIDQDGYEGDYDDVIDDYHVIDGDYDVIDDYDDVIDCDYDDVIDDYDDVIEAKGENQPISAVEDDPVRPKEEESKKHVGNGNSASIKQVNNNKKKKKKRKKGNKKTGIVERLQERGRAAAASSSMDGKKMGESDEIKGKESEISATEEAPQMSLLDAVAAMILGEKNCVFVEVLI